MDKKNVLFICTNNSCRSQIAEGFLNSLYGSSYQAFSAGTIPTEINPNAVKVMKEIGIDLSKQNSKSIENLRRSTFDIVVTLCDNIKETCPYFPGKKVIHKSFEDPSSFQGTIEETLNVFRKIRDEILDFIKEIF